MSQLQVAAFDVVALRRVLLPAGTRKFAVGLVGPDHFNDPLETLKAPGQGCPQVDQHVAVLQCRVIGRIAEHHRRQVQLMHAGWQTHMGDEINLREGPEQGVQPVTSMR